MATKTIDSDLDVCGVLNLKGYANSQINYKNLSGGVQAYFYLGTYAEIYMLRLRDLATMKTGYEKIVFGSNGNIIKSFGEDNKCHMSLGENELPWVAVYSKKFIVPDGTNKQFLKADGSLDGTEYATVADLNTVENNAWKLSEANAEVEAVVLQLTNKGIFESMTAAKINPLTSRNIYVDLSKAESTLDIFAGYKDLPVGVRYHIFFGNTSHEVKLNWTEAEIESNIAGGTIGLTPAYPTAKCEFMRVTEAWTYADWEAKINNVSHVVDTGTLDDANNSILQGYLDKNGISYEKTSKGSLFNLANMLAALAGGK